MEMGYAKSIHARSAGCRNWHGGHGSVVLMNLAGASLAGASPAGAICRRKSCRRQSGRGATADRADAVCARTRPISRAPAAKPHRKGSKLTTPTNPDLDTDDQLAPSQMQQQMPAAVAQPSSAPVKPTSRPCPPRRRGCGARRGRGAKRGCRTKSRRRAAAAKSRVIACNGVFSKDSSHLRLAMTFDTKNVTFTDVDSSTGTKVPASVLFPNDPKRRLEVWWTNPAARNQTYLIVINGKSTWTAPGGMKLGLTLAQLEKLNHKPFKVKGFDKDGTATVSDWDGGLLANARRRLQIGDEPAGRPEGRAGCGEALSADKEYSSSDPAMRAVKPTVSEILIGY